MTTAIVPVATLEYFRSLSDAALIEYVVDVRDLCLFIIEENAQRKPMTRKEVEFLTLLGRETNLLLKDSRQMNYLLGCIDNFYNVVMAERGLTVAWPEEQSIRDFAKIAVDCDKCTFDLQFGFSEADERELQEMNICL